MTVRHCLLGLLGSLFVPLILFSQVPPGTLTGSVLDPNRDPLPRATVRLLAEAGEEVARALTDTQGKFRFGGLPAGSYTLSAELVGFETFRQGVRPGAAVEAVLGLAPVREQVVVTATRTEAPTAQVGASTTVITSAELENPLALPVSDLLRPVAGAAVVRSGGLGTVTSLFVRGGESDHNKVLLDGIPLNEPGGFFELSNLMAENLEQVEVVRGPQSALFGSDALASVVQLFTRRAAAESGRPRFRVSFEGGNHATWRGRAGLAGAAGPLEYSFQAARLNTDNQEPNNSFGHTSLSGRFGLGLGKSTALAGIVRGELGRVGTPGQTAFGRPDQGAFLRRRDAEAGLTLRNQTAAFWEQRLRYSLAQSRQVSRDLEADPPFVPTFQGRRAECFDFFTGSFGPCLFFDFTSDFLNHTRRHHLSYQSDWRVGHTGRAGLHLLTFAFDWDRELGFFGDRLAPGSEVNARRDNTGWVLQHQDICGRLAVLWLVELPCGRLSVTSGLRVEDNDSFGTSLVPRISVAGLLRQGGRRLGATKLKFNFGLGIKEPSLLESFSPGPFVRGNPELAPERTRSFDVGAEQRFWGDRGKLELNWFDNRFRDLIGFEITSFVPFTGSFFNIGRTKAKGAEVVLELVPGGGLRGLGSYTFLDSIVTRSGTVFDPVFEQGNQLLRRPKHSGALRLSWEWRRLAVHSTTLFVGRRTDSDFSLLGLRTNAGYTRWDLGAQYRSPHRVTYFGTVENLLNRSYMEVLGFPALKLSARAGARVEF